ncbi:hypothetical protein QR77_07410 [Streptomyces sp. 150FB]|uniref:hypothetical protein n=1 Tax=Streptomyces sp. 150FB TaxID=1576605 RepID=UPI00058942E3|nr:hypothetical protein [Streptomyces sp. 150FB]KIF73858.1 hypothetical protein QR77_07410 [Streptomyces sp. 150FB]
MRTQSRRTTALVTAVLIATGFTVASEVRGSAPARETPYGASTAAPAGTAAADEHGGGGRGRGRGEGEGERRRGSQAYCRTQIHGSHAVAHCQNPYPETDRVRLHIECARWWDVDADSAPVDIPAAGYVQLTNRCWKEIRSARISHEPVKPAPPGS